MPFVVRDLIEAHRKPVTVHPEDSLQVALTRMTEHEYSQLPVVDGDDRHLGMVTSDSILRALKTFGVTPASLLVRDAKTKASVFREEDDLFELLDDLRDSYAVLIVDEERHVTGVVTGYDATEYFRRRTENMMFVEDIELTLKDHIQAAHTEPSGDPDESALQRSIQDCTRGASGYRKHFFAALQRYLDRCDALAGTQSRGLNATLAGDAFAQSFESEAPKSLDKLTFADYEEIVLSKDQWPRYADVFEPITAEALRHMLDGVRDIRNALAHFRADVTPEQHEHLKFCFDWLKEHPALRVRKTIAADAENPNGGTSTLPDSSAPGSVAPPFAVGEREVPDEIIEPRDSRYAPLALFLMRQPRELARVSLTFSEVEEIIQGALPPYARQHRAFWSNDTVSHPQSRQWLDVDWRVASVDMSNEVVVFSHIKEREKQYIDFFSALLARVREFAQFTVRSASPDGQSWALIAGLPERGPQVAMLGFSFSRNRRFRVELYVDSGDKNRNKRIFDHLYARRRSVEAQLLPEHEDDISNPLILSMNWERLDDRRACRVALVCPLSITDDEGKQQLVIAWAASAMLAFEKVMNELINEAVREDA